MNKVSIIDSETSNLFSIKNAIRKVGIEAKITSTISEINQSEILVLPGVGSFKQAMHNLNKKKIIKPILLKRSKIQKILFLPLTI